LKHKLLLFYSWTIRLLTSLLPESSFSSRLRGFLYSFGINECGKNFQVSSGVILQNLENLSIGNNVYFAPGVVINAIDKIIFEDEVMLGFNVVVVSGDHSKKDGSYRYGKSKTDKIYFKFGSWVGANSVILKGAVVGKGTVIGANSVLKKLTEEESIYFGNPIKKYEKF